MRCTLRRYQGENNLPYLAGNVLDKAGYACLLPAMIQNWREMWSAEAGTTDPMAPFGSESTTNHQELDVQGGF